MELNMKTIGDRIKARRKELRLTQTEIKALSGISSGNLSDIENGNRLPAATTLVQLAAILQCSIDWMLTGESPISEKLVNSVIGDSMENELLNGFRELSPEDKQELIEIMNMKLRKVQKARGTSAKSSGLTDTEKGNKVG